MAKAHKRLNSGDVLKFKVGNRFGHLQFVGTHAEYGDTVLVSPGLKDARDPDATEFSEAYIAFYPANAAVSQGLVEQIAHWPSPALPDRLRRAGRRSGKRVETWIVESGLGEIVKTRLSDEELRLPIAAIWNHELLVQRVAEGWNPAQEGTGNGADDGTVALEIPTVPNAGDQRAILHYLYLPSSEAAEKIAIELRRRNFRVESRLGGDGMKWLVLARHEIVPTRKSLALVRRAMEKLVSDCGGEYDGWEADVAHRDGESIEFSN
jgi:hypothetical protein